MRAAGCPRHSLVHGRHVFKKLMLHGLRTSLEHPQEAVSMGFAIVLPAHNEEQMLKRTLPSITNLEPDEIIILLDRCTDGSEEVCKRLAPDAELIEVKERSSWKHQINYLYALGIGLAEEHVVLLAQADVSLDPRIRGLIHYAEDHVVSFRYLPYLGWNTFTIFVQSLLPFVRKLSGVLAFPRDWQFKYELISDSELEFDTEVGYKVQKYGLPYIYFRTACWNLRYRYGPQRLYEVGRARRLLGRPLWTTALVSMARLQPAVLIGYLRARGGRQIQPSSLSLERT